MNSNVRIVACIVVMLTITSLCEASEGWTEDFEAAKKRAKEEKKDLLVDFTGSDWCEPCMMLEQQVLGTEKFKIEAPKSFVLVKLDFPRKTPQDPEIKKKNAALMREYKVGGFPTIILMSESGKAYAQAGYQPGGPEGYLKNLDKLRAGKAELFETQKKLAASEGDEKLKLLDKVASYRAKAQLPFDKKLCQQICDLDADGKAGLKKKYESIIMVTELSDKINTLLRAQKVSEVFTLIDETAASEKLVSEQKQSLLMGALSLKMRMRDMEGALKYAKQALAVDPNGPAAEKLGPLIKQMEAAKAKAAGGGGHSPGDGHNH